MDNLIPKVTLLQLEKMYGKSSDAKNFVQDLIRGILDMNVFDVNPWLYWSQWEIQDYKIYPSIQGQAGVPHPQAWQNSTSEVEWLFGWILSWPQAPNNPKARMFKVLKEIAEDNQSGQSTESSVSWLVWIYGMFQLE